MNTGVFIVVVLILLYLQKNEVVEFFSEFLVGSRKVKATNDGRFYKLVNRKGVLDTSENYADSANKLAYMTEIMANTVRYIRNKYYWNDDIPDYNPYHEAGNPQKAFAAFIQRLIFRWNPSVVIENAPPTIVNTSYVKDKGTEVAFCLRPNLGNHPSFHVNEILQFVSLHELTHIATLQIGHKTEFWRCFKFILKEAGDAGIHKPINFKNNPASYCSLKIDYNPIFDGLIDSPSEY